MKKITFHLVLCLNLAACLSAFAVDRINVTDYGAMPNDGVDDSGAINLAVNAGTSIYFPPGKYNCAGRIYVPGSKSYRLYGDGPGVSDISFTGASAGIYAPSIGPNTLKVDGLTLETSTAGSNYAIYAVFLPDPAPNSPKFHTATIENVEIRGNLKTGSSGGYWVTGIYLYRAWNSVIDKVDITGNTGSTATGITWGSASNIPTTGLHLTNTEIKFCNSAVFTFGWVEGFYMSGFEVVLCGKNGHPALDLNSSQISSPSPAVNLLNGHIDMIEDGVSISNFSAVKVSNVDFERVSTAAIDGTHLYLQNCLGVIISDCTFTGAPPQGTTNENGVFLSSARQVRVSGNIFRGLLPSTTGSCIVASYGSDTVRITDNIFSAVHQATANYGTNFYYDVDNLIQ